MEQRARRQKTDERHEFVADEDSSIPLDAETILSLLENDFAVDQADDAVNGIANGIVLGAVLWILALGALLLLF